MGVKRVIDSATFISGGDLSADFISKEVEILHVDRVGIELVWTGTPTGPFEIQVSNSGVNWTTVDSSIAAAASADFGFVDLETAAKFIRVFFDRTSGTGTLTAYLTAKSISG